MNDFEHIRDPFVLRAEIAHLRAALEWYADAANHARPWGTYMSPVTEDGGQRARNALAGESASDQTGESR